MSTTATRNLLTEAQAADYLGLSVKTLQSWRWRQTGPPYHKLGGAVRYRPEDLDRWIEESRVAPADPARG